MRRHESIILRVLVEIYGNIAQETCMKSCLSVLLNAKRGEKLLQGHFAGYDDYGIILKIYSGRIKCSHPSNCKQAHNEVLLSTNLGVTSEL